eukprot:m.221979 g.221979  ORF g.221979 m.221979 type:complete len:55 (-) comp19193_c0_seq12:3786-3950(-)
MCVRNWHFYQGALLQFCEAEERKWNEHIPIVAAMLQDLQYNEVVTSIIQKRILP